MSEAAAGGAGEGGAGAGAGSVITAANGGNSGVPEAFINAIPENAREYVTNKGWKSPADILTGYQNLESKLGTNRVSLPKDGDPASEAEFRKALGVPEAADKYDIKLPEGASIDEGFLKTAKGWFLDAGLTPKQAQALAAKWDEYTTAGLKNQAANNLKQAADEMAALDKEWGNQADEFKAASQRAFKSVAKPAGLDQNDVDKIVDAVGTVKAMKMFAHFGGMIAEHRFVNGERGGDGGFTPEAARAEMARLRSDREWFAKFQKGDAAEVARWERLQNAVASGRAA